MIKTTYETSNELTIQTLIENFKKSGHKVIEYTVDKINNTVKFTLDESTKVSTKVDLDNKNEKRYNSNS